MATELIGRRIGPYEIQAPLGAGGMGVVYCAHDHSLGRSVADAGTTLSYRFGSRVYAVSVDTSNGFRASAPVVLFERPFVAGNRDDMGLDYDRGPDGRFLMMKPSSDELRFNRLSVVLNWSDEVTQRVPAP